MAYECTIKDCDSTPFTKLLDAKIHVYKEHGKSWKKARTYLKQVHAWDARECDGKI